MHNDVVRSDILSTDSFGFSEAIFGISHLLGFSFEPRLRNLKRQRLYALKAAPGGSPAGYRQRLGSIMATYQPAW